MQIKSVQVIRTKQESITLTEANIEWIIQYNGINPDDFETFEEFLAFCEDEMIIVDNDFDLIGYTDEIEELN